MTRPDGDPVAQLRPHDAEAEETVAGCAVASAEGARLAAHRLRPDDFYRPDLAMVVAIASELPAGLDTDRRIAQVAEQVGMYEATVRALVDNRAVFLDSSGWFARRVHDAAERRRRIGHLLDELEHEGVDVDALTTATAWWANLVDQLQAGTDGRRAIRATTDRCAA